MKKIVVSSALSALLVLPAAAFEVYNADDKKLDLYGSIRGFVGMGENAHQSGAASYLFGVQNNSHFGLRFQADKFKANVEIGAVEQDPSLPGLSPLRFFWGSYDTGVGTILVGKAQSPTADTAFSSDVFNNDSGSVGFGGLATSFRRLQVQYNIAGLSFATISDTTLSGYGGSSEMPRIAVSYSVGDSANPVFKIAGTYKHYNPGAIIGAPTVTSSVGTTTNQITTTTTTTTLNSSADAWHIWAGTKPKFGNSFFSLVAHYGKNGHLYGEQVTSFNTGVWAHTNIGTGINTKRSGVKLEIGSALSKELSVIIGAGYQETFGEGVAQNTVGAKFKNTTAFVQLPYKVSANFTLTPQIGWYQAAGVKGALVNGVDKVTSVNGAVRVKWDF